MIKSGVKNMEVRKWYRPELVGQYVALKVLESNKIEGYVKIIAVDDLTILTDDELDQVLDLAKVPQDFREEYPCKYVYFLEDFKNVH